jgi:phosphatidylethanolamine-binding protein (PEBP) family uncharacterized protein
MKFLRALAVLLLSLTVVQPANAVTSRTAFTVDIWADNWSALYVNGVKVAEDPISITTTKSFNKVSATFSATYPLVIALIAKDYIENNSGLEYIGTPQQQIGDAGLIAQIHEKVSGKLVAFTSKAWKSYVINKAPLNPTCVSSSNPLSDCQSSIKSAPSGWYGTKYLDTKWASSTEYTAAKVGVKDGYNEVTWDSRAKLIWSSSLTQDNTVLFRTTAKAALSASASSAAFQLSAPPLTIANSCDGVGTMPTLSWSGVPAGTKSFLVTMDTLPGPARPGETEPTDFNHLVQYDIPANITTLTSSLTSGVKGKNFKGSLGWTPPCSQGPGLKTYTFHIYALSNTLGTAGLTGAQALARATIVAQTKIDLTYTRS